MIDLKKFEVERFKKKQVKQILLNKTEYYIVLMLANNEWNSFEDFIDFMNMTYTKDKAKFFRRKSPAKYLITKQALRIYISRIRKKGIYIDADYGRCRYRLEEEVWIK